MKSLKNLTLLVLALTSIGGAILAWQQYQELVGLRASALSQDERASLQKRVWDLERYNKELNDQLAALRDGNADEERVAAAGGSAPGDGAAGGGRGQFRGRGGNPQQMVNAMRDLMAKPEVQALLSVQQKAAIDARYASLFKSMNLSPEQADKVKNLLADRQTTMMDVMMAAREQGVRDPAEIRKLMADAQADINSSLKSVIGEAGLNQLQNYEQTMPQRNLVNQLQQRLSYTDTPLSQSQADQLVQVLASNAPAPRTNANGTPATQGDQGGRRAFGGGGPGGDMGGIIGAVMGGGGLIGAVGGGGPGGGGGGQTATITPAAVSQASSVLAAPQVDALKQIQQQQQAQQQLQQIMRGTFESQNQNAGAKGATTTTPATTNPRRKGGG